MAGCVLHKGVRRVRLFGRFLGLYDDCSHDEFNCYLDVLECIHNTYSVFTHG